jgi:hypothetical protein
MGAYLGIEGELVIILLAVYFNDFLQDFAGDVQALTDDLLGGQHVQTEEAHVGLIHHWLHLNPIIYYKLAVHHIYTLVVRVATHPTQLDPKQVINIHND